MKKEMSLNEYQKKASISMLPQCKNVNYLALGLAGETGELCDKLKRIIRGDGILDDGIPLELGDCLWNISQIAALFNISLETVAQMNIDKLQSRLDRDKIKGQGDRR